MRQVLIGMITAANAASANAAKAEVKMWGPCNGGRRDSREACRRTSNGRASWGPTRDRRYTGSGCLGQGQWNDGRDRAPLPARIEEREDDLLRQCTGQEDGRPQRNPLRSE